MTGGGPGIATMLPALVVYDFMFQRGQLGRGSAAAVLLLLSLLAVLLPYYVYAQWRARLGTAPMADVAAPGALAALRRR